MCSARKKWNQNTRDAKVRCCVPPPVVSQHCPNIMQPVSGGSSFSHSPTHELWVAGRLTGLDNRESVEREQPWEQCLPAALETCQLKFQLKSQKTMLYCAASQLGPENIERNRKWICMCNIWWQTTHAFKQTCLHSIIHSAGHSRGSWAAQVLPKEPLWLVQVPLWCNLGVEINPSDILKLYRSVINKNNSCETLHGWCLSSYTVTLLALSLELFN